ncbi:MAG: hypothetical protein IKF14_05605 [Atopobiaceae bacterium]|nr:hypothetical protein [Atopobiaceae bacterium]
MAERVQLENQDLENVVGGALRWKGDGTVYPKDNPNAVYHYNDYAACLAYIKTNWSGGAQNEDTLKMLKEAGLVW